MPNTIHLAPPHMYPPLHSNRAECYLQASEYRKAIRDCNRSLCLDMSLQMKVQRRRARAYQKLDLDYAAWLDMK